MMHHDEQPPSAIERRLVYRCLLESGILIGSEADIWTSVRAHQALETMRICIAEIHDLVLKGQAVLPAAIKLGAKDLWQRTGWPSHRFALDEVADFLVNDSEARRHWENSVPDDRFPHTCPLCKRSAAFVGFNSVECKAKCTTSSSRH